MSPARHRRPHQGGARPGPPRAPRTGRDRRPRLPQPATSRRPGCTRCCSRWWRRARRYGHGRRPRRPAHQPRVRVGQPHRSAARRRRPLGGGGRRARPTCSRRRAPIVHREYYLNDAGNQLDTFAASLYRPLRGGEPPEDGYQGAVPRRDGRADASRARRRGHRGAGAGVGLPRQPCAPCRTTSPASACTSTPGSPSARCTRRGNVKRVLDDLGARGVRVRARRRHLVAHHRLRRPARPRAREVRRVHHLPCNDIAYHRDKFDRGWEHLIDIWGADHHGQVKSLQAGHGRRSGYPDGRARGPARSAREADEGRASRSASPSAPAT